MPLCKVKDTEVQKFQEAPSGHTAIPWLSLGRTPMGPFLGGSSHVVSSSPRALNAGTKCRDGLKQNQVMALRGHEAGGVPVPGEDPCTRWDLS